MMIAEQHVQEHVVLDSPDVWIVDPAAVAMVDKSLAFQHAVLPLGVDSHTAHLHLAMTRPDDRLRREAVLAGLTTKCDTIWHRATDAVISEGLQRCYGRLLWLGDTAEPRTDEDADVVRLVDGLLHEAVTAGASDLHLTPERHSVCARIRCDGRLVLLTRVEAFRAESIAVRVKVMAALDIAETRRPQDGRLQRIISARLIDMRVSSFPSLHGENIVIRIHDRERVPGDLDSLGIERDTTQTLRELLESPPGLTLVCGPTGSGKTTTLYAILNALDDGSRSLLTLEDPVEHPIDGVVQASVDPSRAIDFASGARALLRQDPDVLMIGEIRDQASCRVALRAALSGVRVFATVHADDSCTAIARMAELGASADELAATLRGVVAQRLLRRITGTGRLPIVEILICTSRVRAAIAEGMVPQRIVAAAFSEACQLTELANQAVSRGLVCAGEVRRVLGMSVHTLDNRRRKDAQSTKQVNRV